MPNEKPPGWLATNITSILALVIVGLTFLLWTGTLFHKFEDEQKDVVLFILGSLSTMSAGVVAYYFGSSSGSQKKSDTIDKMIK